MTGSITNLSKLKREPQEAKWRLDVLPRRDVIIGECEVAAGISCDNFLRLINARSGHLDPSAADCNCPERISLNKMGVDNDGRNAGGLQTLAGEMRIGGV